ncbi:TPA: hypothetical protein N0F65_005406 [Lagenidium giganteum]|uniref:Uncharacterized protein n=1 Tax=Lagenidium giganteum TaxID=4803 RepID=A0AAV2Z1D6_9STRA|nr:TPA: hypothetical protein N0F65_005406 [Lagenidium giganteum]
MRVARIPSIFCEECSEGEARLYLCNTLRLAHEGTMLTCVQLCHYTWDTGKKMPTNLKRQIHMRPGSAVGEQPLRPRKRAGDLFVQGEANEPEKRERVDEEAVAPAPSPSDNEEKEAEEACLTAQAPREVVGMRWQDLLAPLSFCILSNNPFMHFLRMRSVLSTTIRHQTSVSGWRSGATPRKDNIEL